MRRARNRRQRRRVALQDRQHHILDLLHEWHNIIAESDNSKMCQNRVSAPSGMDLSI